MKGMRRAGSRRRSARAACAIFVVAMVMQGCGRGSDAPHPPAMMERTNLDQVRADAVAAAAMDAAAARTAAGEAAAVAAGAEAATLHLATLQTGGVARLYAMDARSYAGRALAAARAARQASDDAATAADARSATRAGRVAAAARTAAEEAAGVAAASAVQATAAAGTELAIDGTVIGVGGTFIDVATGTTRVLGPGPGGAGAEVTGLLRPLGPTAAGGAVAGVAYVAPVPDDLSTPEDETVAGTPYRQAVAARTYAIGRTLDSADDTARLMLVTHYAGSRGWRVFAPPPPSVGVEVTSTKAGWLSLDPATGRTSTDAAHAHNTPLTSVGMYLPAGAADGVLSHTDQVAADARPVEVFSYTDPSDGTTRYATQTATVTHYGSDGGVSWIYTSGADVTAPAAGGPHVREVRVAADVPAAVAYRHLQFGIWAALGEATRDGGQSIASPGIGFVQGIGDGLSGADLPVSGDATYAGNWVAAVSSGAGRHALRYGPASLTAKFGDGAVTATLAGLAVLEGRIDGSTFAGTKATAAVGNRHGLAPGGSFAGTFGGGFYGGGGEEAGGVFDFASPGLTGGGFRGAFGGARQE